MVNGHNPYANYIHRGKKHIGGGSLFGTLRQFSIPVEPSHETENDDKSRLNVYHSDLSNISLINCVFFKVVLLFFVLMCFLFLACLLEVFLTVFFNLFTL
jgi:hypothetical protein